jgi:hypothetical protein
VLAAILRDAARQYRRRPLALLVTFVIGAAEVGLARAPRGGALVALTVPAGLAILVVDMLSELFLIAYLAGGLEPEPPPAGQALAAMRRAVGPGIRGQLLKLAYLACALLVAGIMGVLVFGRPDPGAGEAAYDARLTVAFVPLGGFALAFLAVLLPRIVLGGERRAVLAAAASHRVARAWFPLCLALGLAETVQFLDSLLHGVAADAVALGVGTPLTPFVLAAANALYLRTRTLQALTPERGGTTRRR